MHHWLENITYYSTSSSSYPTNHRYFQIKDKTLSYNVVELTACMPWTRIVGGKSAVSSVSSSKNAMLLRTSLSSVVNSGGAAKYRKLTAV